MLDCGLGQDKLLALWSEGMRVRSSDDSAFAPASVVMLPLTLCAFCCFLTYFLLVKILLASTSFHARVARVLLGCSAADLEWAEDDVFFFGCCDTFDGPWYASNDTRLEEVGDGRWANIVAV